MVRVRPCLWGHIVASVLHLMNFLALVVSCILLYAMNQAEVPSWSEAVVLKFKTDRNRRGMWKTVL